MEEQKLRHNMYKFFLFNWFEIFIGFLLFMIGGAWIFSGNVNNRFFETYIWWIPLFSICGSIFIFSLEDDFLYVKNKILISIICILMIVCTISFI